MFNSRFKGPEESPGFLLWQLSTSWRREIEKALSPLGLTHPQFVLLASIGWLTREGDKITQANLAKHSKTDINQTSQVVRTLEKKGYVERKAVKGDERAKSPKLTKSGKALLQKAIPLVESVDLEFFSTHGKEDVERLIEVFFKLTA